MNADGNGGRQVNYRERQRLENQIIDLAHQLALAVRRHTITRDDIRAAGRQLDAERVAHHIGSTS